MTPFTRRFVSNEEFALFARIKKAVEILPDLDLGTDEDGNDIVMSCHMLARAVAKVFHLQVVDGYFARNYQHSWLITPFGKTIDVYPVATLGGPILMDSHFFSPARMLYQKKNARSLLPGKFGKSSFRRSVRRIQRALTDIVEIQATF